MNRRAIVQWTPFRVAVALLLVAAGLPGEAVACQCPPRTPPGARDGEKQQTPTYHFSWSSEADKKDDSYCYERVVTNKHETKSLDYEWKIAEMANKALPPMARDRICKIRGTYRDPAPAGPLTYGRSGQPIDTEVWKAKGEPTTGEVSQTAAVVPMETYLDFTFASSKGPIRTAVVLRTIVTTIPTAGKPTYRYRYQVESLTNDAVILSWVPLLVDIAKRNPQLVRLVRETPSGLALEIKGSVAFLLDSPEPPVLVMFATGFFEPNGPRMAEGSAEAFVPVK